LRCLPSTPKTTRKIEYANLLSFNKLAPNTREEKLRSPICPWGFSRITLRFYRRHGLDEMTLPADVGGQIVRSYAACPLGSEPALRFVTASLHVNYLSPTPMGGPLEVREPRQGNQGPQGDCGVAAHCLRKGLRHGRSRRRPDSGSPHTG